MRTFAVLFACILSGVARAQTVPTANGDWPVYGGSDSAQHFSAHDQISTTTVRELVPAWTFHTETFHQPGEANARASFEANPVL